MTKTIAIASDHRGLPLKTLISERFKKGGYEIVDFGTHSEERCDIGDFTVNLVAYLRDNPQSLGVSICGTGQASAMTANRYRHIRAALCLNTTMARLAREHNDANILVLGAHIVGQEVALDCVDAFMAAKFLGGRYEERRDKLTNLGGL
jgi:ribose 5-phosphate isomerase B